MKIVSISGLDGSGKSTQINLLKEYLESHSQRVFYFHAGDFSIANKILGKKKDKTGKEISVSMAGWPRIFLRKIALVIDLWRFKKLYKKLHDEGFDYILSDRYFYDTIINIDYLSNLKSNFRKKFLKLDFRKPDIAIYLRIDPEKIMLRERKPDQGIEYLEKKGALYDRYADSFGMKIVDGNRNKEEIFTEIKGLA